MTIRRPGLCTKLLVWAPKYNNDSLTQDYGEQVALIHKTKIDFATPVVIIEFKAKHLMGQRFCIKKQEAQRHAVGSNGKSPMYEIPMSHFESWESAAEVRDLAFSLWEES